MPARPASAWFAVAFALLFPTLVTLVYFVLLADHAAGLQRAAYAAGKTIQFAFPAVWVFAVLREKPAWARPTRRALAMGLGFGVLVFVLMLVLYAGVFQPLNLLDRAAPAIRDKITDLRLNTVAQFAAVGVFYSLCHSLLEEYYWRWFVYGRLRLLLRPSAAIAVSSLGFMAHHVILLATFFGWLSPWTYLLSSTIAIGGAFWAWLYDSSRSLYGPWLSHLLVDAAIFLVGFDIARDLFV